jgi:hypothetical protein
VAKKCSTSCGVPKAFYFTVEAISNILISGVSFRQYNGVGDVTIYTAAGGYDDKRTNSSAWNNVFSDSYNVNGSE